MANVKHAPHLRNVQAAVNKWDPMHGSIYEVTFSVPGAIKGSVGNKDLEILSQQVTTVSGLDVLQKTVSAGEQKFYGVTVSYLNPTLDTTAADLTIEFNLNIRNSTDAYVLRVFKEWAKLGYDLASGTRHLMSDYLADNLTISEANRDGVVWRVAKFQRVMLTGVTGLDGLDYTNNEARKLTCTFRADFWDEEVGSGTASK